MKYYCIFQSFLAGFSKGRRIINAFRQRTHNASALLESPRGRKKWPRLAGQDQTPDAARTVELFPCNYAEK